MHRTFDASSLSVPPINTIFNAVLLFGSPLDPTRTFDSSSISEPPIKSSVDPVQSLYSAIFAELYFDSPLDPLVLFDVHRLMSSYEDLLFYVCYFSFYFILFEKYCTTSTVPCTKCVTCEMYYVPYVTQNVTVEKNDY